MMGFLPISLLVIWLGTRSANAQDGVLFPHGAGDESVESQLDYSSAEIIIPVQFPFFGQTVSSAYVSTNGVISFGQGFTNFIPQPFPLAINTSILAVFWSDINIIYNGTVTYLPYLRTSFNEDVFGRAEAVIRQAFGNQFDFTASWMLIATWNKVPFYGSMIDSLIITNTFQAVIITDGTLSFAMYNYEEIAWTTGTDSDGDPYTGLGGDPAQVGYNAGDGTNYYSVPESMTDAIVNIDQRSNIGTRGRWLFRIDTGVERAIVKCPHDVTVNVEVGMTDTIVIWSPLPSANDTAGDVIDPATIICEDQEGNVTMSGDRIGAGTTIITCTTNGTVGLQHYEASCQFTIRANDSEPPVVKCPEDAVSSLASGASRVAVYWLDVPTATDVVDGNITYITCGDENNNTVISGGLYTIGVTIVTCTARDYALNQGDCTFYVRVSGQCAPEVTEDTVLGSLSWPVTMAGLTAESIERCPLTTTNAGFSRAVRNCSTAPPPLYFYWEEHVPKSCGEAEKTVTVEDIVQVDVTEGNAVEVAEFLANHTSTSSSTDDDVEAISQILENIVNAGSGDPEVTDAVIETVSNVIMDAKERQDSPDSRSSTAILRSVEAQVSLTLQQEGKVSIQQDAIHVEAVSIDPKEASNGFSFVSVQQESAGSRSPKEGSLDGTEIKTFTNASEIPKDVVASIQLPANIIYLLPHGNSTTSLRGSFIVYADDTLFQTGVIKDLDGVKKLTSKVAGSIVSLTVEGVELKNLTDPVVIDFKILPSIVSQEDVDTIKCVFWEIAEESGFWSTEGCELAEMTDDKVSCDCDHATNFAILVDVKGQKLTEEGLSSTPTLDIISQIGGALSVVALTITLVIYLSISKLRTGKSRQVFINFCVSLLMLYIVFLAGVDNARGSGGGCVFVGALLHYLTLTTMMWMAVEARNMYVSTVKVFPEYTPRYMVKAGLLAWGSPLIVLTVTLAAAKKFYQHDQYCFISPGLAMYLGLLTPIGIILLHNVITFILVMRSLLQVKEESRSQQISKRLQNAVGISALMGLTWCFGFLAIEGAGFTFQLLFCLTNSLQGVVVGVMFCARREEVRAALAPYLRRICCCHDCQAPKTHSNRSYDLINVPQSALGTASIHTASLDISVSAAPGPNSMALLTK